ncbi:hypothetical protein MKW92_023748 [Papaver armeniacum]|nr:hypothetical protein MKW92_023748 [Papaver armeniacum]
MFVGSQTVTASLMVQTKPGCSDKCGNVSIPYPFGMFDAAGGEKCSINGVGIGYGVTCNTSYNPPKPFLGKKGNLEIVSISESEIRVKNNMVAAICHTQTGVRIGKPDDDFFGFTLNNTSFTFSSTKNRLFGIGCDITSAIYIGNAVDRNNNITEYVSMCRSVCNKIEEVEEESCTGSGCCQSIIPKGINRLQASVYTVNNHTKVWSFDQCSYAIFAEQDAYTFHASDLLLSSDDFIGKVKDLPFVLDWAIGNKTCEEASELDTFACQENSKCINSDNRGYRCSCNDGYEGNPYLSPGCQGTFISYTFEKCLQV